jgi:transposase-like protein
MNKRPGDTKTTAMVVIEGLTGKPVAEICTAHQISQSLYDLWRDQFLAHAATSASGGPAR